MSALHDALTSLTEPLHQHIFSYSFCNSGDHKIINTVFNVTTAMAGN